MKKVTLLGIALICVFAGIYSACDNPAADTKSSNTGNLGEYSEHLMAYKTDIEKISQEMFGNVINFYSQIFTVKFFLLAKMQSSWYNLPHNTVFPPVC